MNLKVLIIITAISQDVSHSASNFINLSDCVRRVSKGGGVHFDCDSLVSLTTVGADAGGAACVRALTRCPSVHAGLQDGSVGALSSGATAG